MIGEVYVNGEGKPLSGKPLSVAGLLEELSLAGKPVAVELNREVVPRARHAETILRDGDTLEIVTLVGGG